MFKMGLYKDTSLTCVFLLISFPAIVEARKTPVETDETRLINDLLNGYNHNARPVINASESVQVDLSMKIMKLEKLDTRHQFISVLGFVSTNWKDERLAWNRSEYGGLDYVAIWPADIWVPTFVLANTANAYLYEEFWYSLYKVKIKYDGSMHWAPGGVFKAECLIDVHLFPFDDQICHFQFANWVYSGDKVNLTFSENAEKELLKDYNGLNGQWDIIDEEINRIDLIFESGSPIPEIHFGLHLRRKPLFYVMNIVFLSILFAVLVLLVFQLPPESGERISMGMTQLLAFLVFILLVNENIPETSAGVPLVIIYLLCFMTLTTLGIAESVLVLHCFHHSGDKKPPRILLMITSKLLHKTLKEKYNMPQDNHTLTIHISERYEREQNERLWQNIARAIDKMFFWVFFILFIVLMLTILVIYPTVSSTKNIDTTSKLWHNF